MPFAPTYDVPAERRAYVELARAENGNGRIGVLMLHGFIFGDIIIFVVYIIYCCICYFHCRGSFSHSSPNWLTNATSRTKRPAEH